MRDANAAAFGEDLVRLLEQRGRHAGARPVQVIVLGDRSRGDDAVAYAAVHEALSGMPDDILARVDVRATGQLDPADLVELPERGAAVVVDAIVGVPVGCLVRLSLGEIGPSDDGGPVPRSSHVLPVDQLIALAGVLRGGEPPGCLLGVGAERFGFGEPLSPAVADAVPALSAAVRHEVERLVASLD